MAEFSSSRRRRSTEDKGSGGAGIGAAIAVGAAVAVGAALVYGAKKIYEVVTQDRMTESAHCRGGTGCSSASQWTPSGSTAEPPPKPKRPEARKPSPEPTKQPSNESLADHLTRYYEQYVSIPQSEIRQIRDVLEDLEKLVLEFFTTHHPDFDVTEVACQSDDLELQVVAVNDLDLLVKFHLDENHWKLQRSSEHALFYEVSRSTSDDIPSVYSSCVVTKKLSSGEVMKLLLDDFCESFAALTQSFEARPMRTKAGAKLIVTYASNKSFTVNVIPAIHLHDSLITVPSPRTAGSEFLWLESFAGREMQKLHAMDTNKCCHLKCIQLMKAVALNHPSQFGMCHPSVFKTVVLHMLADTPDESMWLHQSLPEQFIDMLLTLVYYVQGCKLPHFFVPEVNLLEDVPQEACSVLVKFIHERIGKESLHTLLIRDYRPKVQAS